jgi:hypothetical protein
MVGNNPLVFGRFMHFSTFTVVNWDKVQLEGGQGTGKSNGHEP